jgi:hypothetical protein
MNPIILSLLGGLGVGGILAAIFALNEKKGKSSFSKSVFGMESTDLIADLIVFALGITVVFLGAVSLYVRDLTYPSKSPWSFTLETFAMALLGSSIIFIMTRLRGYPITTKTFEEFGLVVLKFGVLHILLQFSGFYSYIFPPK